MLPQQLPEFNRWLRTYGDWVKGMPKPDPFFLSHKPRTVACKYGQNAQILYAPGTHVQLANKLDELINFGRCDRIGFALATTVRYLNLNASHLHPTD